MAATPVYQPTHDDLTRFWSKVRVGPDCWEWQAARTRGYGQISINGAMRLAHRFSFEINVGPISPGLFVLHKCDNRRCVRPEHLFLGTNADNMADMVAKSRQFRPRGTRHWRSKLTDAQVRAIRADPRLHREIAADFGITKPLVSMIKARRRWQHVDD